MVTGRSAVLGVVGTAIELREADVTATGLRPSTDLNNTDGEIWTDRRHAKGEMESVIYSLHTVHMHGYTAVRDSNNCSQSIAILHSANCRAYKNTDRPTTPIGRHRDKYRQIPHGCD